MAFPESLKHPNSHIGYCILDIYEECYERYDEGCFIADSRASARRFLKIVWGNASDYRIDRLNFATMMKLYEEFDDEYDMELQAYARFQQAATLNKIPFSSKLDEGEGTITTMKVKVGYEDHEWAEW